MDSEAKSEHATASPHDEEQLSRRDLLASLGKWSKVIIAGAVFGGAFLSGKKAQAGAWVNRRLGGGAWANARPRGGAWVNRR
jgi:hypothetical protein